ncbi:MAG: aspartate carbamoyltransferase catalytic subunit [Maricaulaceae bacterium]
MTQSSDYAFAHRHLLGVEGLNRLDVERLLDVAADYVALNRRTQKRMDRLAGRTLVNLFFEPSTGTQASFELAAKRLGMDAVNMAVRVSTVSKGETLIDTAATLNAMRPDLLVVRHGASGAVALLARQIDAAPFPVECAVVNAGDGAHEHPTQALLDALTIRRRLGRLEGLTVAICGDVAHSRVARSNLILLQLMGAQVRLIGPPTLVPGAFAHWGAEVHHRMETGLNGADVVMMLRLQRERMEGAYIPSPREYFQFYGVDEDRLKRCAPDALVMHPGPMNRGVEIDSTVADDPDRSVINEQVEMGVAVRMAVLDLLATARETAN